MTKSGEVIFSHYFNYQAKRSNQPHNDGCWAREGERGKERGRERGRQRQTQKDRKWEKYLHWSERKMHVWRKETKRKQEREGGRDGDGEGREERERETTKRGKYLY